MMRKGNNEEGVALVLSLIALTGLGILLAGIADRTRNQFHHASAYAEYDQSLQALEAGFAMARAELNGARGTFPTDKDGLVGVDPSYNLQAGHPFFGDTGVSPFHLEGMPHIEYIAYSYNWSNDNLDNNGNGSVDEAAESGYYSIYATVRADSVVRRAEMIFESGGNSIWDNAIFAGGGQGPNLINGNVSIHGSIHLLGDGLSNGDFALDLSGTARMYNNYAGMPAALEPRVPALPTTVINGETVETLEAKLRVKNGLVGISGNASVGEPEGAGDGEKDTLDGIYVNDGWGGNKTDGNGDPQSAYSDNGWDEAYDNADYVPFPTYPDDGGRDHLAYYLETDADPNVGLQHVHSGDLTIEANKGYYWNATTGDLVTNKNPGQGGMPQSGSLNFDEFFIWFDAGANHMIINGRIPVDGDIAFERGNGNDRTVNYSGKGTFLAYDENSSGNGGDVNVETDMLSQDLDGTTAGSFPANNLFGIHAEGDMTLGSNSQLSLMGGFYAQGNMTVNKQSNIVGTIVGESFVMNQVPDIYQVPELADQWTDMMRMIGSEPSGNLTPLTWRELGVL